MSATDFAAAKEKTSPVKNRLKVVPKPPVDDETADVSLAQLKLAETLNKANITVNITDILTDGRFEDTTTGAPELTVDILDRNYKLSQSGTLAAKPEVELDGIPFRLAEVSLTAPETFELLFEHKLVSLLREHDSPLKANRATTTRAQFFEMMLREITDQITVVYVCPEINKVQPTQPGQQSTGRTLTSKTLSTTSATAPPSRAGSGGFSVSSLTIRGWDGGTVTLGPQELQNIATVLQVCQQDNAPPKAVLSAVETCIVETGNCSNPGCTNDGTGHYSSGMFQRGGGGPSSCPADAQNIALSAHLYLTQGFWKGVGAIHLAQTQPSWSAGQISQYCQGSAFPSRYDAAGAGATTIINAFHGGTGGSLIAGLSSSSSLNVVTKQGVYEFSRGQSGQKEDSWTCMQRLASEVNWRVFVAGRNTVYFVTDDDLLAFPTRYKISPGHPGVGDVTFQAEVGGRTIVRKGKRQPKPSEAQVNARTKRWWAPPGSIIELDGYGVGDDRWIVSDIQRPLFDRQAQITLAAPQKPGPEPPTPTSTSASLSATTGGVAAGTAGSGVGGYGSPFSKRYSASLANTDMGVDFGRQQGINTGDPIMAIGDCYCRSTQQFYTGSINPQALWFELVDKSIGYWGWYLAEEMDPRVGASGNLIRRGAVIATYAASGTGIEIGFAGGPGQTATQRFHPGEIAGRHNGNGTTDGRAFLAFLKRVGAIN